MVFGVTDVMSTQFWWLMRQEPHDKAKNAARWPLPLCQRIAAGCEEVIREHHRKKTTAQVAGHRQPAAKSSTKRVRLNDTVSTRHIAGRGAAQNAAFPLPTDAASGYKPRLVTSHARLRAASSYKPRVVTGRGF